MKNYKEYTISTFPFNVDLLSGALWQLKILGINEYEKYLKVFVNEDFDITNNAINSVLEKLKKENLIQTYNVTEDTLESKNWNEEWEKKINVVEVTDKIVIKPSFREYKPKENQIVITIDPKMSFGTGEHETTKIMLILLEEYVIKGAKVLDVGSGTSILGIAASKLGAKSVLSVDNDEWCYVNGKENVEKNNVSNVKVMYGIINDVKESNFNLVLANINKNVLLEIKEELFNKCSNQGIIILSGILKSNEDEIKRQFTQLGLTALKIHQINEWIGIVLQKN